jgi:putative NADPH-quinone reductase
MTKIALIQGHPTSGGGHFCHALALAYREGANGAGHEVHEIEVTALEFPVLRSRTEWETQEPAPDIAKAQETIGWAEHLVVVYPLWLGTMPALLKAFLEQAFRPGFAMGKADEGRGWSRKLAGKSARIVVTMGMPALLYRWYFGAHGLKSLEQSILGIVGIKPSRHTLIGSVEAISDAKRQSWLSTMRGLGRKAR